MDLSFVKPVTAPNGHRRIEAVIYVSMPAANMIQGLSVQYDYQMDRSLRHLINAHDKALKQIRRRISLFGVQNKGTQESLELLMMAVPITIMDKFANNVYMQKSKAMILPADFGDENINCLICSIKSIWYSL